MNRNTMLAMSAALAATLSAAEAVRLETPTGILYGAIEVPGGESPFPVVVMHAGSGPTDRDGNSAAIRGKNNSLKMLAEALAERGIASLRYDKRGIAESAKAAPKEEDLRFETYAADLVAWGKQLRADKRFSKIVILGHSEGALIGTLAAQELPADAFISVAGAGKPAGQIILEQTRAAPPDLKKRTEEIVAELDQGKTAAEIPQPLAPLFRPSVQPYLISWFRYDPAKELAKLKSPVLIVQGSTDIQVTADDARLLAAATPGAKLVLIEGMNHVLKNTPSDLAAQLASYGDPELPVAPRLIEEIAGFVQGVNGPRSR
jgi:hypothetical protein